MLVSNGLFVSPTCSFLFSVASKIEFYRVGHIKTVLPF